MMLFLSAVLQAQISPGIARFRVYSANIMDISSKKHYRVRGFRSMIITEGIVYSLRDRGNVLY